ncbi:MAG: EAL domain-containing protein [Agrobacterium sp.]|nr:EAL domain-containing protein [Agrobacterium sp.]
MTPDSSWRRLQELSCSEVRQFGLPVHALVVEITERQPLGDRQRVNRWPGDLLGSRCAGLPLTTLEPVTMASRPSPLLNAHIIKIDKYFVDGVIFNRKSQAMIEMLVSFASEFGMEVVAEGIETEEQLSVLLSLGIKQGRATSTLA